MNSDFDKNLTYFENNLNSDDIPTVFIHGVGEGVLKLELEYLFSRYDNVKFYDADYQKYGLGATEVYIYQNVAS